MLWVNIVMDTLGGLAFSGEPALEYYMKEKPKRREEPILSREMINHIALTGSYTLFLCFLFLRLDGIKALFRASPDNIYQMTAFYALFIFAGIFNCFGARCERVFILSNIKDNEEPAYFAARARILYEQRNYEECIKMCISYNERRPATTASNYIMLANCYKRLQKPSKALKALRKAEEINASKNYIKDLSSDIASLEMQAEAQKERRLSLAPKKK
jgi:tetratricopeptide (TPR) repeat protein